MSFAIVISISAPCGPMLRFSDDKAVVSERMPWHVRSGFVDPWVAVSIYRDNEAVGGCIRTMCDWYSKDLLKA